MRQRHPFAFSIVAATFVFLTLPIGGDTVYGVDTPTTYATTNARFDLDNDKDAADRATMIELIQADVTATAQYIGSAALLPEVLQAMAAVPRHPFVPADQRRFAYANRPLPIGHGQTISQPYIVALMTHLLGVRQGDKVLEIGTGSGYQAAILRQLSKDIFTIEIVPALATGAKQTFSRLGLHSIQTRLGDGYFGWQEEAPFDAIMVTAAASHIPPPLVKQLKPGGRMVIPVGSHFYVQHLVLINKNSDGVLQTRQVLPVRFVPLTGGPNS